MEWEMAAATTSDYCSTVAHMSNGAEDGERRAGAGVLCVKVMTDEQMEVLRRQISAYATICEQLAEMHRAVTAHQDSLAGMRLGSMYSDALMAPPTARPRWTPTPVQLQILESIYDRESGGLGKQRIKGIALELLQYGQISESNVYNWFQNRKARTKRKQTATLPNTESEIEADVEAPNEKRSKSGGTHPDERLPPRADDLSLHSTDTNSVLHSVVAAAGGRQGKGMYAVNDAAKSIGHLGQMPFCENELLNPSMY